MQKIKKMARTKMIATMVADQRYQAVRAAAASSQWRRSQRRQRISVKNIEGRICGRSFKTKRLLVQQRNLDVKKDSKVARKMIVRTRTMFLAEVTRIYY